jgi:hypothetical protein
MRGVVRALAIFGTAFAGTVVVGVVAEWVELVIELYRLFGRSDQA